MTHHSPMISLIPFAPDNHFMEAICPLLFNFNCFTGQAHAWFMRPMCQLCSQTGKLILLYPGRGAHFMFRPSQPKEGLFRTSRQKFSMFLLSQRNLGLFRQSRLETKCSIVLAKRKINFNRLGQLKYARTSTVLPEFGHISTFSSEKMCSTVLAPKTTCVLIVSVELQFVSNFLIKYNFET